MTSGDICIFTGPGIDMVSLTNLDLGISTTVSVDTGADNITGTSLTTAEDAVFEGEPIQILSPIGESLAG